MSQAEFVDGMSALADRFEGFVLDQWGVLHNGSEAYEGAIEAVDELHRRGKRMVLLSNSGRRASENAINLRKLGFNPSDFSRIVTSGEVCWQALASGGGDLLGDLGKRCLLLARDGDKASIKGLDLELVQAPEKADFIYLSWLEHSPKHLAQMDKLLEAGPRIGLPMVCANPDRVAPVAGGLIEAPGTVAARYEAHGGKVVYVGKPHRPIYTAMLNAFEGFKNEEILCVGDSLEHDIQGANGASLPSCLIASGIHAHELGPKVSRAAQVKAIGRLAKEHGGHPDFIAPSFSW